MNENFELPGARAVLGFENYRGFKFAGAYSVPSGANLEFWDDGTVRAEAMSVVGSSTVCGSLWQVRHGFAKLTVLDDAGETLTKLLV